MEEGDLVNPGRLKIETEVDLVDVVMELDEMDDIEFDLEIGVRGL